MLYKLILLLQLLFMGAFVSAGKPNTDFCRCDPNGSSGFVKQDMVIPVNLAKSMFSRYPGSCVSECNVCSCESPVKKTNGPVRTFSVKPNPAYHLPTAEEAPTIYACTVFDATLLDEPMWITNIDIQTIANQAIIHHGVLYGVEDDTLFDTGDWPEGGNGACVYDKNSCIEGAGKVFGHGDVVPNCFNLRNLGRKATALYAFQRGNPDFEAPEGTGIRVGPGTGFKYLLFQAHYHNIDRPSVVDVSGLHIRATTTDPGENLGILLVGNFPYESIYAMPGQEAATMRSEIAAKNDFGPFSFPVPGLEAPQNVYPCAGGERLGLRDLLEGLSNWPQIESNGGIDLRLGGIHFHGSGEGDVWILRSNVSGVYDEKHIDSHKQMGHGMHKKRMPDHHGDGEYSDNNLHYFTEPHHVGLFDGIATEIRFNTSMMGHSGHMMRGMEHIPAVIGGYATDQEMAHAYYAYTPAPVYQPFIQAFAPCRTCAIAEPVTFDSNGVPTPQPSPKLHACDGSETSLEDYQRCYSPLAPVFGQQSLTGRLYWCYPNAYNAGVLANPVCSPTCN